MVGEAKPEKRSAPVYFAWMFRRVGKIELDPLSSELRVSLDLTSAY